ncbi:hypothetical protein [Streptomyces bullii]|uniref:DUF4367 domain-containing protein n=1 Tax=Streptomyces bullii TaxID=349910 RepID=A0ABW0UPN4_9ACTN
MSDERDAYDGAGGEGHRRAAAARLRAELMALGRSLDPPGEVGAESMVERVLEQLLAEHVPVPAVEPPGAGERLRQKVRAGRRRARARWRSLTAVLCGLLALLTLTPPVRAAVSDWFGFGGVQVRYDPSAVPSPGTEVPGCGRSVPLADAERRAGFAPLMPETLGPPDGVTVSGLPRGRVLVSLCWRERGHTVRLDEFRARLDTSFIKTVPQQPELLPPIGETPADGIPDPALWFPRPHLLTFPLVGPDGARYTWRKRTAGPTLLWTSPGGEGVVTLRLEGVGSKERAVEIAESLREPEGGPSGGSPE